MSNRISPEKAKAIAQEYCSNGFKKGLALRTLGYAASSSVSGTGLEVYDNLLVKAEITAIQAKTSAEMEITQAEVVNNARLQVDIGKRKDDANAIRGGNDQLGRIAGSFEKDNLQKAQGVVIMICPPSPEPKPIDSKEIDNGRREAEGSDQSQGEALQG